MSPPAGSRLARQVFASAASVAQHSDWPLVWSVQPLLEPQRVPMQNLRQQLGMRSPPPLSAVLQHVQTVRRCCWAQRMVCTVARGSFVSGVGFCASLLNYIVWCLS